MERAHPARTVFEIFNRGERIPLSEGFAPLALGYRNVAPLGLALVTDYLGRCPEKILQARKRMREKRVVCPSFVFGINTMNGFDQGKILSVLDGIRAFPILDNWCDFHNAANRLTLFRSETDWAMVFESFTFAPKFELPDLSVQTFASCLLNRNPPDHYVNEQAYLMYLKHHPNDDSRFFWPVEAGGWLDPDNDEIVAREAGEIILRGKRISLPPLDAYAAHGIELQSSPTVFVFELCRYLAAIAREDVLATPEEQRVSVMPEMVKLLQLEEWHHPNILEEERPSHSETFRQLAEVLATGDVSRYRPSLPPNTHWSNWPDDDTL